MAHYTEDKCSTCGKYCSPELLTIKRVQFVPKDNPRKILKSRSVLWQCESCRDKDPDWNREAYSGPGNRSEPLERVRDARR